MDKKFHTNLIVSSAPHIVTDHDTTRLMGTVILALCPALIASTFFFGARVLLLAAICMIACVAFEYFYNAITHKRQTVGDLSAVLTGVLLAMNLPSNFPIWKAILGCAFAILVVKCLYGGLGKNFVNPAITGRIFLFISFASDMSTWPQNKMDTVTGATPLALFNEARTTDAYGLKDLLLGFHGGAMGEVCALALLVGGIILIVTKVISPIIPCSFIGTVFIIGLLASGDIKVALFQVLTGGVMLGAFFMATDYVTSPKLPLGQLIFGIGCGLITMGIRYLGSYPEGVSFSILFMNLATPLLNRLSFKVYCKDVAKRFGGGK